MCGALRSSDRRAVPPALRVLLCAGADRDRFGIKGGCNLRFFFESVRYSEDIDFDVAGIPVHTLKEKVNMVLGGPALAMPLRSRGISIAAVRRSDGK